jgi:2-iminobutanoate/2-iminopropanoate deaminase
LTRRMRLGTSRGSSVTRTPNDQARRQLILVFITDMKLKPEMNRAWKAFFNNPDHLPARATLGISSIEEGVLIEIVTTAALK